MNIQEHFAKATNALEGRVRNENAKDDVRVQRILSEDTDIDGSSIGGGRIIKGAANAIISAGGTFAEQEKERKKKLNAALKLSSAIAKRIADLDREIDALEKQIEEMDKKIEDSEEQLEDKYGADWKEKLKRGEIDPNDPMLILYLQRVQDRETAEAVLEGKRKEREKAVDAQEEHDQVSQQAEKIIENGNPEEVKEAFAILDAANKNIEIFMSGARDTRAEQRGIEVIQNGVKKVENQDQNENRQELVSVDEEVGEFMRELYAAQSISDPAERLVRERELFEAISDEAIEYVEMEEKAEKLFEEGYFDTLSAHNDPDEGSLSAPTQQEKFTV